MRSQVSRSAVFRLASTSPSARRALSGAVLICGALLAQSAWAATAPSPSWAKDLKALGNLSVSDNGDLSFIGTDAKLHHLDSSGKELWSYALGDIGRAQPVITPQGNTLVAAYDDTVQALDSKGKKLWFTKLDGDIFASPALRTDGSVVVASSTGTVYALSNTGQILWKTPAGASVFSSPVIGPDQHIYFGTQGNTFMSLDADGKPLWSFATGATVFSSPALDAQGNVYFGSGDKKIYSLTPAGKLRWSYSTGGFVNASPIVTSNNLVVVGSYDSKVYALTTDGQKVWEYSATSSIAAPAAELVGGTILVGDLSGNLHALGLDGKPKWVSKMGDKIDTSVNVSAQGTVYVASAGKVSALNVAPLASGPWSFYRDIASGYGRPLTPQEAARVMALKQTATQKILASMPKPLPTSATPPKPVTPPTPTAPPRVPSVTTLPISTPPVSLGSLVQTQGGAVWFPATETLSALKATQITVLPGHINFAIGSKGYSISTRILDIAANHKRQPWLMLKDLNTLPDMTASYQNSYKLSLNNKVLLDLKLNLSQLLPLTPSKEYPDLFVY